MHKGKMSKRSKFKNGYDHHKEVPYKLGSYNPHYIYKGKMKDSKWRYCKIIEVVDLENISRSVPKTPDCYRYYMHFFGLNRRMDDWMLFENIIKTPHTIEDLHRSRKNKELFLQKPEKRAFLNEIEHSEDEGLDPKEQESHEEATKVKTISEIEIGKFRVDTWYFSPFPEGYHTYGVLYFCEFCLSFFIHREELLRHI